MRSGIFRSRSVASVVTLGLVALSLLVLGARPALAAVVVVNQDGEQGWHMQHTVCIDEEGDNTGSQDFVPGPQGAAGPDGDEPEPPQDPRVPSQDPIDSDSPNGGPPGPSSGSLEFEIQDNGWSVESFRNLGYDGVAIEDIESIDYWTYEDPRVEQEGEDLPALGYVPAVYIELTVDTDGARNGPLGTLIFEPAYQDAGPEDPTAPDPNDQHDVDPGAWQRWIAEDADQTGPEGRWWLSSRGAGELKTLDEWTAAAGDWTIVNAGGWGGVSLTAGCGHDSPWSNFAGNTDRFTIKLDGKEATTYDFEPRSPADASTLDCEPETAENSTLTDHTITCTATNEEGLGIPEEEIDFELEGANDTDGGDSKRTPDYECTTDEEGSCSITHGPRGRPRVVTDEDGVTTYTAWIDIDGGEQSEANEAEPRDETNGDGADEHRPNGTDVVEKTWVGRGAEGGGLDAEPENATRELGASHTITVSIYDQEGDPLVGRTKVNFELFEDSPSDDDGNSPQTPDHTCTSASDRSSCAVTFTNTSSAGTDLVCVYMNEVPQMDDDAAGGECGGEEVRDADDSTGTAERPVPEDDDIDVVEVTWTAPVAARLDCQPETATAPSGSSHRLTCEARNSGGRLVPGAVVAVEATGANDPDSSDSRQSVDFDCVTGANGTCSIAHGPSRGGSSGTGETQYRAWLDADDSDRTDESDPTEARDEAASPGSRTEPDGTDRMQVTWVASPLECEPEVSSGALGARHNITCSARAGARLDLEITGANDPDDSDSRTSPDLSCTVASDGRCVLTHSSETGGDEGTSSYRIWIDADGSDSTDEADATEARDEGAAAGSSPETDGTDVVERTWTNEFLTACNDGNDNDGDGTIDHPDDPDCASPSDDDEGGDAGGARETCPGFADDTRNQIVGTRSTEDIYGTSGDDIICGFGGDDFVYGRGGDDLVLGGRGADGLRGGAGADDLRGRTGRDRLFGGRGPDDLDGGRGFDRCDGGPGRTNLERCER